LLTSTAAICAAQPWEEGSGSDWTNDAWDNESTNIGWGTGNNGENNQNTDSWGSPPPAEVSEPSNEAYFPRSVSESSETLIDDTTGAGYSNGLNYQMNFGGGSSQNIFWIVSKDGTKYWSSINIPCGSFARLLIIPSTSGQLIMEELYPDGQVQTYYYGYVGAKKPYKKWFFADTSGIHRMRYRIDNGPYSNILTFHVGKCKGGGSGVCPCCGRPF
jgi:hypothetical protein